MKRLGVFVFYDKDNIVDDYVIYLLEDMCKNLDDLVILSNSTLNKQEKKKLLKFTNKIIERENIGLDAGAWCEFFRQDKTYLTYDEVVCFNDTFFGPIYPFKDMFDTMSKLDIDFWGMTQGNTHADGYGVCENGIIPNHIQTFLITFRKKVVNSKAFQDYWQNYDLDNMLSFVDVVSKHELKFTKYLEDNGFTWDTYIKDLDATPDFKRNYINFAFNSYNQIVNAKAPFIKRKTVVSDLENILYLTDLGDIKKSMQFIKEHTNYPISLIYKNILRIYPLDLLRRGTGFHDIIKEKKHDKYTKVSILIKLENPLFISNLKDILKMLDKEKEVLLYTKNKSIYEELKDIFNIKFYQDNFQKILISDFQKVKSPYINFIDIKNREDIISLVSTASVTKVLDNLFLSLDYYESVLDTLKDANTSVVYTPFDIHFDYFYRNLFLTPKEREALKIICPNYHLHDINNFIINSASWIAKKEILLSLKLNDLKEMKEENFFVILSTALALAGATKGKLPKIILNEEMALIRLNTLESIYEDTYRAVYQNHRYPVTYLECLKKLRKQREEMKLINVLRDTIKRKLHIRRIRFWLK